MSHHIWCGLQPARTVAKRLTVAGKKGSTICCRCQQGGYGGSSGFVAAGAVGLYGLPSYAGGTAASRNPGRFTMGGRRSRVDRREMASAARTSLYREHGGGTGRKVAARPNRARSVRMPAAPLTQCWTSSCTAPISTSRWGPPCTTPPPNLIASVPNFDREDHGRLRA